MKSSATRPARSRRSPHTSYKRPHELLCLYPQHYALLRLSLSLSLSLWIAWSSGLDIPMCWGGAHLVGHGRVGGRIGGRSSCTDGGRWFDGAPVHGAERRYGGYPLAKVADAAVDRWSRLESRQAVTYWSAARSREHYFNHATFSFYIATPVHITTRSYCIEYLDLCLSVPYVARFYQGFILRERTRDKWPCAVICSRGSRPLTQSHPAE